MALTKAASGTTAANHRSLFRGRKLLKLQTVGYALPEMPLSIGGKLELLSEPLWLPNFCTLLRILTAYVVIRGYIKTYYERRYGQEYS